ncbi:hypothetical protein BT96DRAFT_949620 [Gymnopus androsaceus JB14]|uniref:Uncharacterized protein n=1 Tax=Gymnopus androsaceus JB14 TaxID=1447944 RepID=A0A6A4GK58_9AGAR|nr:hypothetical protein BT96DRAFT_949620 [Gymnopus androsaceus JB14]
MFKFPTNFENDTNQSIPLEEAAKATDTDQIHPEEPTGAVLNCDDAPQSVTGPDEDLEDCWIPEEQLCFHSGWFEEGEDPEEEQGSFYLTTPLLDNNPPYGQPS